MDQFVKDFKDRYNIPPSDWAVMAYDAFTAWAEGVKKANSFDGDKVSKAMSGLSFASTRGTVTLRTIDHQANVSEYEGVLQTDATIGFDTFANVVAAPPNDILLTPDQVTAARAAG
jgi:ABC-type branched-subunit amino acid transport system substrate-binding protein